MSRWIPPGPAYLDRLHIRSLWHALNSLSRDIDPESLAGCRGQDAAHLRLTGKRLGELIPLTTGRGDDVTARLYQWGDPRPCGVNRTILELSVAWEAGVAGAPLMSLVNRGLPWERFWAIEMRRGREFPNGPIYLPLSRIPALIGLMEDVLPPDVLLEVWGKFIQDQTVKTAGQIADILMAERLGIGIRQPSVPGEVLIAAVNRSRESK